MVLILKWIGALIIGIKSIKLLGARGCYEFETANWAPCHPAAPLAACGSQYVQPMRTSPELCRDIDASEMSIAALLDVGNVGLQLMTRLALCTPMSCWSHLSATVAHARVLIVLCSWKKSAV